MKKQILIVEDEQIIAMDIHNRLLDMGYGVAAVVSSGEEAVRKTEELRPDLILMDITLGKGIDGIEASNRINTKFNIPIIYISSNIAEDRMEQIQATNPFGFITKPFEDKYLRITIEMALYRHRMEEALCRSEEKYRTILESIEEAYLEVDLAGNFIFFNDALCMIAGVSRDKLLGMNNLRYAGPETAKQMYQTFNEVYRTGKPSKVKDYQVIRPDGIEKTVELSTSLITDSSGTPTGFRGIARDVTERKLAEETLRKSEERYRALFENNPIETIIVDKQGMITGYNYEKIKSGVRLPNPGDIMYRDYAGRHTHDMHSELMECIRSGVSKEFPDEQYVDKFLYIKISPFPEGAIITSIDITERKRVEARLSHLATHDPLTGLPNRILFDDRLSLELAHAQRNGKKLAIMLLDLDHFKDINDSWGHTVGDEVLKITGRRLPGFLRKSDSIARMGGDEFLILLPEIDDAEDVLTIALKILDAFKEPFIVGVRELYTTPSIGIAIYPDDGTNPDMLLKNADIAMYCVKQEGRNNCRRYASDMHAIKPLTEKTWGRFWHTQMNRDG
ncbi:MAG TPA: diguanylate cyclase [Syntrophales bacterium]|nr:diguanylate cyclase [Syntrophales bacterium]HPQ44192.1 diguanylate cyclase [Syntrophales bacterium]